MQKVLFFLGIFVLSFSLQACSSSPTIDGDWKFNREHTVKITDAPEMLTSPLASLFDNLTMNVNTAAKKCTIRMNNIARESSLEVVAKKEGIYTVSIDGKEAEWKIEKDDKGEEFLIIQESTTGKNVAFSRVKK